ncbi:MAG: ThuA domain-containing protein, partial [Desulfobulbaceae bacterium]|nr:ThuA domain-containing protein [Desulfobulbaceae bacterium]
MTIAILPTNPDIQARLEVTDPDGGAHFVEAAAPGEAIFLHNLPSGATNVGSFSIEATSISGTGDYQAVYWLNAVVETESYGGPTNDDITSALTLSASSLALPNGADRLAVVGKADNTTPDYYSFTLSAGQQATLALSPSAPEAAQDSVTLELRNSADELISIADGTASNATQSIRNFVAPTDGTYYARISGQTGVEYTLLVTRNADFDLDPNGQISNAQPISATHTVLGNIGSTTEAGFSGATIKVAVYNNGGSIASIISQLNDDTYFDFTATSVSGAGLDTVAELNAYDVVIIGDSDGNYPYENIAPALRSWVEAGGGVVGTGWLSYYAGSSSGAPVTDIDAIIPIQLTGTYFYTSTPTVTIVDATHPITQNVVTFSNSGQYISSSNSGADAGASVLATTNGMPVVVAAEAGLGRSAYLGPVYGQYNWSSTNADRLLEQAVAWAASGKDTVDHYTIEVTAGSALTIETTTPGGTAGEPINDLVPLVELFAPSGSLVSSQHNNAADGRNVLISLPSEQTTNGTYRIKVTAYSGTGDYTLQVSGASAPTLADLTVTASVNNGATLPTFPDAITLTFSSAVDATSLLASDLTVNGTAADNVTLVSTNQARFAIASLAGNDGDYTVQLDAAVVRGLSGQDNTSLSLTFTLDTTGPSIISSTPDVGEVLAVGANSISITFDQELDPEQLSLDDVALHSEFNNIDIAAVNLIY